MADRDDSDSEPLESPRDVLCGSMDLEEDKGKRYVVRW